MDHFSEYVGSPQEPKIGQISLSAIPLRVRHIKKEAFLRVLWETGQNASVLNGKLNDLPKVLMGNLKMEKVIEENQKEVLEIFDKIEEILADSYVLLGNWASELNGLAKLIEKQTRMVAKTKKKMVSEVTEAESQLAQIQETLKENKRFLGELRLGTKEVFGVLSKESRGEEPQKEETIRFLVNLKEEAREMFQAKKTMEKIPKALLKAIIKGKLTQID